MNKEIKNENNNNINGPQGAKTINTIIKDLSISPQKKLYIYLNSKPHEMINEKNNTYKYYLYDIKEMFLTTYNNKENSTKQINKEYIPQ